MCFSLIFSAQNFYSIDLKVTVAKTRGYVDQFVEPFFANFEEFSKHLYLKVSSFLIQI